MTAFVGSRPVIGKYFPHFLFFYSVFFDVQTDLCKLKFTGFMITSCLIKTITAKLTVASVLIITRHIV